MTKETPDYTEAANALRALDTLMANMREAASTGEITAQIGSQKIAVHAGIANKMVESALQSLVSVCDVAASRVRAAGVEVPNYDSAAFLKELLDLFWRPEGDEDDDDIGL